MFYDCVDLASASTSAPTSSVATASGCAGALVPAASSSAGPPSAASSLSASASIVPSAGTSESAAGFPPDVVTPVIGGEHEPGCAEPWPADQRAAAGLRQYAHRSVGRRCKFSPQVASHRAHDPARPKLSRRWRVSLFHESLHFLRRPGRISSHVVET